MTTVHTSPDYNLPVKGSPPPGYPQQTQPDPYTSVPFAARFAERRKAFFDHCLNNPAPPTNKAPYYELARLAAGGIPRWEVFSAALEYIEARKDCADFVLHSILRLLYGFQENLAKSPPGKALLTQARQTVLGFKYWPDEPGLDSMCTWTENHQVLFASGAYLAGQLFPDEVFTNAGRTGREQMAINRPRLLRWLDLRFRTGFSEWLSHVYYDEDLTALVNLVDFAADQELASRSAMVIDLILADIALNSIRGVFGSTHGRSYVNTKKWAAQEGTTDTAKLMFGVGQFSGYDNMSAVCLATSSNYRVPPVLYEIANELRQPEIINRQRMGIRLDEADRWGLGFDSFEDGMVFLSLEAYTHPRTINLVTRMFDAYHWWENSFFQPFQANRRLIEFARQLGLLPKLAHLAEFDVTRNTREEVNIYTYRTPDYMLSSAQDYRPGYGGDQQHIWQATFGQDAVVFTTHPAKWEGPSPNYWTGSGTLPRVAQVKNTAIIVYRIDTRPGLYHTNRILFTHAWLPRDRFDEVVERDGWIFARYREGYLALFSQRPYIWQEEPGEDCGREIIAPGNGNIWICELGRQAVDGEFTAFMERILAAELSFGSLSVVYHSPTQGQLEFGWHGPLRQDGQDIPLHGYPRYDNPYARATFPAEEITFQHGDHALQLHWQKLQRTVTSP